MSLFIRWAPPKVASVWSEPLLTEGNWREGANQCALYRRAVRHAQRALQWFSRHQQTLEGGALAWI